MTMFGAGYPVVMYWTLIVGLLLWAMMSDARQ